MNATATSNTPKGAMQGKPTPQLASPIIRLPIVEALAGVKRGTIYTLMRAGKFPRSVHLSTRAVGWYEEDVRAWCATRQKTVVEA